MARRPEHERQQSAGPQVKPELGIHLVERLIARARELSMRGRLEHSDIQAFNELAQGHLAKALGSGSESIRSVMYVGGGVGFGAYQSEEERQAEFQGQLANKIKILEACIGNLRTEIEVAGGSGDRSPDRSADRSPIDSVGNLLHRFHLVARQLRSRQRGRPIYAIADEYDVQDLLHALLRLEFDDVRSEETTPSYAGGSSRMDFLIKSERIVIEVKCARDGLDASELGKQLIVDIDKYRRHPDCKVLFCYVYDAESRLANPAGIEFDLSGNREGLDVYVLVRP